MGRKVGFFGLVFMSLIAGIGAALLISLMIEATLDGVLDSGLTFFAFVMGTIFIAIVFSVTLYNRILKEKISWGY
jgi:hypothetical protein